MESIKAKAARAQAIASMATSRMLQARAKMTKELGNMKTSKSSHSDPVGTSSDVAKTPALNLCQEVNGKHKMVEWGWKSKLLMESPTASKYTQLYQYKPYLDENIAMTPWREKVSVPNAISDYLRALHEYAADTVLQEFGRSYSRKSFRYCLTVPAMWSDKAKDVMRKAAIRADLITAADHPDRLTLVSEPEAAALYCEKHANSMISDTATGL
ncbi:hypothetical protein BGX26_005811 [Mortierella sp. AD094]|nr:hypothetical protein BGX26_005811 [Mortierella sp. AD094]